MSCQLIPTESPERRYCAAPSRYREWVKIALVVGSLLLLAFLVTQSPKITHCEQDGWCTTGMTAVR